MAVTKPAGGTVVCCVDGSDLSMRAVEAGLAVVGAGVTPVFVTVVAPLDETLVSGTGFAGGTLSPAESEELERARDADAADVLRRASAAAGVPDAATQILLGDAGSTVCQYARETGARAIVIGTRGRGGLKRAVLGSVSDYVVRNAPCPVVVTGDLDES
jgi:nucleotide-binding universal stress UspA family protein